jgi:hypothetical protein
MKHFLTIRSSSEKGFALLQSPLYRFGIMSMAALTAACSTSTAAPAKKQPASPIVKKTKVYGSWRLRPENWQWFQPKAPGSFDTNYTFTGSVIRVGVTGPTASGDYNFELAETTLLNLPKHASGPAPLGNFGAGGNYYAFSGNRENTLFIKQAYLDFLSGGKPASLLTLGRFEFNDGMETKPTDPSVVWIQQNRIGQRLIGTFGYTDIGRSFDGGKWALNTPQLNLTAVGAAPTEGVYSMNGTNNDLGNVRFGYLAVTKPQTGEEPLARIFGIVYEDTRSGVTKTDNRPAAVKAADKDRIRIGTIGANFVKVMPGPGGKVDLTAWGATQFGKWGSQNQGGYAYDAEIGYQPSGIKWKPWLRAGYYYASGDDHPTDNKHDTFFPILPTPRVYARFPFYSETNLKDAFIQLIGRPTPKLTLRADAHSLSLASSADLWYQGGGAFLPHGNFGYAGTPSGGNSSLANLYDISADYKADARTTFTVYYGVATPGSVIKTIYTSKNASLGYVEMMKTF